MGIIKFFDKLEDKIRHKLSRYAVVYALIVGFAVVLFWDGVERFVGGFDFFTPEISIIISVVILLLTGTMVSFFIGNETIISGLKTERRIDQKTETDIRAEEEKINHLHRVIEEIRQDVAEIKKKLLQ
ncbi:MAG: hypothetical protein A2736_02855 [Candidatus Yanofskybacteria bacterium RIFCSPHIGHO2_01_FULL_41_27]|uniref:Uncharacterized protein n=4 Tax=Parcubacteria group TaxID=1794811 RepID=A0A1F8HVT8_9BACT|nr:MAG: hypothetical protein UU84_C0020G0001 [Candidatus Yanofskybacteria bacterium GW2011_GWC2_41_9]OGM99772.1 MAG: hypothetical protein A2736_02855 [Candidatus Yanofskybacteria bacterium RIFCSPHIGHO2_01_FULL_41_27]OGN19596.1 MAG: hypothetical protein A3B00_01645 [Candidatus Yanofskybacteria bacterium RIFCSPLOWO2_01_FULL_41_33]OGN41248.1 MAG: hypothetical protein A2606_03080 [Candidatus Yanofskybacteria bacterium RIFOXYD1_FULL_42_10]